MDVENFMNRREAEPDQFIDDLGWVDGIACAINLADDYARPRRLLYLLLTFGAAYVVFVPIPIDILCKYVGLSEAARIFVAPILWLLGVMLYVRPFMYRMLLYAVRHSIAPHESVVMPYCIKCKRSKPSHGWTMCDQCGRNMKLNIRIRIRIRK